MGGVLPKHPQRVLALGGTAGMVHPRLASWCHERWEPPPLWPTPSSISCPVPATRRTQQVGSAQRMACTLAIAAVVGVVLWSVLWSAAVCIHCYCRPWSAGARHSACKSMPGACSCPTPAVLFCRLARQLLRAKGSGLASCYSVRPISL